MKGQMETVVAIQAMTVSNNDRRTDHRDYRRTRSLSPYRDNYNHVVENVLPVHTVGAKGLLKKESTGETMTEKDHRIHAKAVVSTINVILAHSEMQYVMLVGNVAIYKVKRPKVGNGARQDQFSCRAKYDSGKFSPMHCNG